MLLKLDQTKRRPDFTHLDGYKIIHLKEPSYENCERYLSLLFSCVSDSSRSASRNSASMSKILSVMQSRRSPLLVLLAFIASFEASESNPASEFQLLKSICSRSCRLTISNRIKSPVHAELIPELVLSLERLTMCYAMSIRLTAGKLGAVAPGSFMEHVFGPEATAYLQEDVSCLCSELEIPELSTLPSLLHAVFHSLSGVVSATPTSEWPFVHRCFEDYYCGLFLEEVGRRSPSSTVFELVLRRHLKASFSTELFLKDTALKEAQWGLSLEIAACQGGPMWLLSIFAPTLRDLILSSSPLILSGRDRGILSSRVGFLLITCELDSNEHKQTARMVIDRLAAATGVDLSFPVDAEVNVLLLGASGKRAGLLDIIERIVSSKHITEVAVIL